jgi:hypothetical protein
MCFDCKYRNIRIEKGDLQCHCSVDGRWRNPYRPRTMPDVDCPNWARKEEDDDQT